jgi:hypothetical protein
MNDTRTQAIAVVRHSNLTKAEFCRCARSSIRPLISANSDTSAFVFLPASVAASISLLNKMAVAKSAVHSRQNLSILPELKKFHNTATHTALADQILISLLQVD